MRLRELSRGRKCGLGDVTFHEMQAESLNALAVDCQLYRQNALVIHFSLSFSHHRASLT